MLGITRLVLLRGSTTWSATRYVPQLVLLGFANLSEVGLGTVGQKAPANVVVSVGAELHFTKDGMANNNERRYYYFGTDIPDADRVGSVFGQTPSPTKKQGFMLTPFETPTRRGFGPSEDRGRSSIGDGDDSEREGSSPFMPSPMLDD
jgi:hypothetical protein